MRHSENEGGQTVSTSNEQTIRRFFALWATRKSDDMAALFATDGVYENVPGQQRMAGREEIRQWLLICFKHLTRIDVEIMNIASNGEWVLSERIDTHVIGDRHMPLPVMNAARIVAGEIAMFRDYYDRQTVAELGMG
jgi:limonene-1,2-epoxide hydrolase